MARLVSFMTQAKTPTRRYADMTVTPPLSPWPAPSLADAAVRPTVVAQINETPHRSPVAALLTTARRLSSRSERAEHAALKEEQRISDDLRDLPVGWYLLESLGVPEVDGESEVTADDTHQLRHAVIGPGGVFIIHLEHHPDAKVWVSEHALTIDGRESDRLRHTRFEARHASGILTDACGVDVTVQAVLVLIDAATMQTLSRTADVHVRTQHDLRDWLCKQPARLDAGMVKAIHDRVRPKVTAPSDPTAGLLE